VYAVLGCTVLTFNRGPLQILLTVAAGCLSTSRSTTPCASADSSCPSAPTSARSPSPSSSTTPTTPGCCSCRSSSRSAPSTCHLRGHPRLQPLDVRHHAVAAPGRGPDHRRPRVPVGRHRGHVGVHRHDRPHAVRLQDRPERPHRVLPRPVPGPDRAPRLVDALVSASGGAPARHPHVRAVLPVRLL